MALASNSHRLDPYKNFKFRLIIEGRPVFGANSARNSGIPALAVTSEVVQYRAGGSAGAPVRSPGHSKYDALTLQRGVTYDPSFSNWANQVYGLSGNTGASVPSKSFRKDIYLEFENDPAQQIITYKFSNCWISQYQSLPALGGQSNAVAIEHIKLENEGFLIVGARRKSH